MSVAQPSCHRCRRPLSPGSLKFSVRLAVTADFDGHLEPPGGEGPASEGSLAAALAEAEMLSEEELEAGVHQEVAMLLCAACRRALLRGLAAAGFLSDGGGMVQ